MKRIRRPSGQTLDLLRALMDEPRTWHHGYALSRTTELQSGTLYPILMRFCDRGLVEHKWLPTPEPGRPPRHVYRLNAKGIAYAREQVEIADDLNVAHRASPGSA